MSSETLRRAAAQMRDDTSLYRAWWSRSDFYAAVADLLDGLAADHWDFRHDEAVAVARAYLGESA